MYPASCCVGSTTQTLTHQTVHPAIHPESPREPQRAGMDLLDFLVLIYCFHCSCLLFHCFALLFLVLFIVLLFQIYCICAFAVFVVSMFVRICVLLVCFVGWVVTSVKTVWEYVAWCSQRATESTQRAPESPREPKRAPESCYGFIGFLDLDLLFLLFLVNYSTVLHYCFIDCSFIVLLFQIYGCRVFAVSAVPLFVCFYVSCMFFMCFHCVFYCLNLLYALLFLLIFMVWIYCFCLLI